MQGSEFWGVVALVGSQLYAFWRNVQMITVLGKMYPATEIQLDDNELIQDSLYYSSDFNRIIDKTNGYLKENRGAAADFGILRDISERVSNAKDEEIQSQISTPLYLGLLGTFAGAIIGLWNLNVSEEGIIDFLGGIRIAMIGSLLGLGLTLLGNEAMKRARARRDRLKDDYYTALQTKLLPKLNSDMQKGLSDLKAVLDSFNQGFFGKIETQLFAKLNQILPLMSQMGEMITTTGRNIAVQRDFLVKLEEVGVTKMANATIKIFDRVEQSAATFEKFMGYQKALNETIESGTVAAEMIGELLGRLSKIEQAAEQFPGYLNSHNESLNHVLKLLMQHQTDIQNISARMTQRIDQGIDKMDDQLDQNLADLKARAEEAYFKYQQWFERLNEDNIFQKIVGYLDPIKNIPAQQAALNELVEKQSKLVAQVLTRMEQRLDADKKLQARLEAQINQLTQAIAGQNTGRPAPSRPLPPPPPRREQQKPEQTRSEPSPPAPPTPSTVGHPDGLPIEAPQTQRPPKQGWWSRFKGYFWKRRPAVAVTADNGPISDDNPPTAPPRVESEPAAALATTTSPPPDPATTAEVVTVSSNLSTASVPPAPEAPTGSAR